MNYKPISADDGDDTLTNLAQSLATFRNGILSNQDQIAVFLKFPIFFHDFTYDVINTRIINSVSSSGSVATVQDGYYKIQNSTDPASRTLLISKRFFKYNVSGTYEYIFAAKLYPSTYNALTRVDMGLISQGNGNAFAYLNGSFGIVTRYDNVDTFIPQSQFNVDKLDGKYGSLLNLDITKLNMYRVWSQNHGRVIFSVNSDSTTPGGTRFIICHIANNSNIGSLPFSRQPNLFVCNEMSNNGSTLAGRLDVYSMAVNSNINPRYSINPPRSFYLSKNVSTTSVPLFSVQSQSTYLGRQNRQEVFIKSLKFSTDGARLMQLRLVLGGTLTGAVFAAVDASLSILNYDQTATAITGGTDLLILPLGKVDSEYIDLEHLDLVLLPGETLSVAASTLSGSSDIAVSLIMTENL